MSTDRVALVTGGSRGIGAATATALAAAGHAVAIGYRSDEPAAAVVQRQVEDAGGRALPVQVDVADPASVDAAVTGIEAELGRITIAVNNAGITDDGLFIRTDPEHWRRVLGTNLDGAFHVIHRVAPGMLRARWGRIVNVSSVVGLMGSAGQVSYASSKAALVGLTRSLARELGTRPITANVVAPGPIETEMLAAAGDERAAQLAALVPAGRLGRPDEVAAAIAFLCSDAAGFINGAVLPVDGGLGMGH
ncbi:MAG TPA: 3-oxoacyl-ACP reductase family protein [Acidimicrobiales bacterium]|nr:3-oxoacyl-ACP reductase family protein [Acidimicrobiales bacterium]